MTVCNTERGALKQAEQNAIEARSKKLDSLRDAMKRDGIMDQVAKNGGIKNALETLHSILRGSNKLLRDSVESNWHGRRDGWLAVLNNELFKGGYKKVAENGLMDKDVSIAWWNLSNGKDAGKGPAAEIAKIYSKALDNVRDMMNNAGARIGDARNYVTTTQWDSTRMRQAAGDGKTPDEAFEAWWAKDRPRMNDKTFQGVTPIGTQTMQQAQKAFGKDLFNSFLTGVYTKIGTAESSYVHPDFANTTNVSQKASAHRAIQWKDGQAWHEHMQDFGTSPTLHASITNSIDRGARSLALMEKLGNNPGANMNMLLRRVEETYKSDVDGVKKFQSGKRSVVNEMRDLDGTLNIPANMGLEKFVSGTMQVESMSTLGGVGVTHLASIWPTVTSELAHHGINRFESIGNMVKSLASGMGDAEHRNLMADLGAYADGGLRHVHGKIGDDSIPGHISSWAGRFMDATGIHLVYDRTKAGIRDMLAHNLGRNIDKDWKDLDPHLTQMLSKYRIGEDEWKLMQGTKDLPQYNGRSYLTPSAAAESLDSAEVESMLRERDDIKQDATPEETAKSVADFKQGMSDKLLSYYSDAAKHGVVTPGVRERATLLQGTQKGTIPNAALRFITQFKMWPVAAMNQILEREVYMSLSKGEAAWNIGKIIALGIPAGYMRLLVSNLASGRPAPDPRQPKTLLESAQQSGAMGIMGDLLFGEVNRMAGGITSLAGPVVSDADKLVQMFNQSKQGKFNWSELAHFGVNHIPFANLVYLKGTLDYMLWYHLYEAAKPGWWERTNRNLQKEQGRTMQGYTPGGGVPTGVPGVYLKSQGGKATGLLSGAQ
jgi:hypothetical protein